MAIQLLTVHSSEMTPAQGAEVIALCSDAFQEDYSRYLDLYPDRVHVLAYAEGRLVSHALWLARPLQVGAGPWLNAAYVEGVATQAGHRGRGYGSAVMRRVQDAIRTFDLGALSPARPDWYARLGWVCWLGPLLVLKDGEVQATPDDCVMIYRTPRSGAIDIRASLTGEWRPFEVW